MRTVILVAGLWGAGLFIPIGALKALPKDEIRKTPCYAGFTNI
jgi:3',5'-cyclic AMP phosphodiesterase CpdA